MKKLNLTGPLSLAVLFGAVLGVTVLLGLVWAVAGSAFEPEPPPVASTGFPKLADPLKKQIDIAMNPTIEGIESAANPFNDKTGVANTVGPGATTSSAGPNGALAFNGPRVRSAFAPGTSGAGGGTTFPRQGTVSGTYVRPGNQTNGYPGGVNPLPGQPNVNPAANSAVILKERLAEQQRRTLRGEQPMSVTEIYGVDDVSPLGVVGTRSKREVLFISTATSQSFAVPMGAQFRDGSFVSVTDDGVVFRRNTGEEVFAAWVKNADKATRPASLPLENNSAPVRINPTGQGRNENPNTGAGSSSNDTVAENDAPLTLQTRRRFRRRNN